MAKKSAAISRKLLDELTKQLVMLRVNASLVRKSNGKESWYGECQWCRKTTYLQWCHIHSRGRYAWLRWDADNALAMCSSCHIFKWHRDPYLAEQFVTSLLGPAQRAALAEKAMTRSKIDKGAVLQHLQSEIHRLTGRDE